MAKRQDGGVTPTGPGYSPKGGAADASPAEPSIPNALSEIIRQSNQICKTASEIGCGNPEDLRIDAIYVLALGIRNRAEGLAGIPRRGKVRRATHG